MRRDMTLGRGGEELGLAIHVHGSGQRVGNVADWGRGL